MKHYARKANVQGRYSAHSMRATFITRALDNGASLERVQEATGHANPGTTKLYDRRGFKSDESAAFFASYYELLKSAALRMNRRGQKGGQLGMGDAGFEVAVIAADGA